MSNDLGRKLANARGRLLGQLKKKLTTISELLTDGTSDSLSTICTGLKINLESAHLWHTAGFKVYWPIFMQYVTQVHAKGIAFDMGADLTDQFHNRLVNENPRIFIA